MKIEKLLVATNWRTLLLFFLSLLWLASAEAQVRRISGKVTGVDGKPVENANVTVKGKPGGTTTGPTGEYSVEAGTGDVIIVSSIGYAARETVLGSASVANVT